MKILTGGKEMASKDLELELTAMTTPDDFVAIFNHVFSGFIGSPRRCAEMLRSQTPLDKKHIADEAIRTLRNLFPGTRWYYAGD